MNGLIEYLEVFTHRKSEVERLLLTKARANTVIKYHEVYDLFEMDKPSCASDLIWRGCVWETVEEVARQLSSPDGAIYYAMLSNRKGVPEDVFWWYFIRSRKTEYEADTGKNLTNVESLNDAHKLEIAHYERLRVYRHVAKYHP